MPLPADPWRAIDRQPDPEKYLRLITDVYQATRLDPFTRSLLERRAQHAVEFGLVSAGAAARWFAAIERADARGELVFAFNFYGAAGVKPTGPGLPGVHPGVTAPRRGRLY